VRPQVRRHEQHHGAGPGERVAPHDADEPERGAQHDRRADPHRELDHAGERRHAGAAEPLQRPAEHEQHAEDRVQRRVDVQELGRHPDDVVGAVADEQPDQRGARGEQHDAQDRRARDRQPGRLHDALPDAVRAAAAEVLGDEHRHRQAERLQQRDGEAVHPGRCRVGRHGVGAEGVEPHLHGQGADRDDRRLEAHRQAEAQVLGEVGPGDPPVRAVHVQHRHPPAHELQAEQDRQRLRHHGGQGGAADAEPQRADEQHHERDVEHAREGEEPQRRPGVADRPDDRGEEVEEHQRAGAEEAHLREGGGLRHQRRRGLQQRERRAGQQGRPGGEQHAGRAGEDRAGGDRAAHGGGVARAERLRGRDGEARGHAPGEPEQQEQQAAGGADRGERVDAEVAADDDGVGELVELLDDVAHQQGDGEHEDDAPGTAGGQDLGHDESAPGQGGGG
jgi:hypothetical protein